MNGFRTLDMWLSIAAAALMIAVNVHRWRAMDGPDRLVRVGHVTLLAAAAYGFGASTHPTQAEIVFRYLLFSTALLYLVVSLSWILARQIRHRRRARQDDPTSDPGHPTAGASYPKEI